MANIFELGRAAISGRPDLGSIGLGVPFDDEGIITLQFELINARWCVVSIKYIELLRWELSFFDEADF